MEQELELWFDEALFDVGLDEYLTQVFEELNMEISNVNNFYQADY
jgi:hypothetical protein